MRSRHLFLLAITALVALGALGGWAVLAREPGPARVAEHPTPILETMRTVVVSATMPSPSAHARRLSAMLENGGTIDEPTAAEVLSDTDCTPDARMISRCRNEMLLPDGREIVLRHPHDMSRVPCLAPGERVLLVPATA